MWWCSVGRSRGCAASVMLAATFPLDQAATFNLLVLLSSLAIRLPSASSSSTPPPHPPFLSSLPSLPFNPHPFLHFPHLLPLSLLFSLLLTHSSISFLRPSCFLPLGSIYICMCVCFIPHIIHFLPDYDSSLTSSSRTSIQPSHTGHNKSPLPTV